MRFIVTLSKIVFWMFGAKTFGAKVLGIFILDKRKFHRNEITMERILDTFAPEERKFHRGKSSNERMFHRTKVPQERKFSMDFSLPRTKLQGNITAQNLTLWEQTLTLWNTRFFHELYGTEIAFRKTLSLHPLYSHSKRGFASVIINSLHGITQPRRARPPSMLE